jgi:hypothetical protein
MLEFRILCHCLHHKFLQQTRVLVGQNFINGVLSHARVHIVAHIALSDHVRSAKGQSLREIRQKFEIISANAIGLSGSGPKASAQKQLSR